MANASLVNLLGALLALSQAPGGTAERVQDLRHGPPVLRPGEVRGFGRWMASCNNLRICVAGSIAPDGEVNEFYPPAPMVTLWLTRKPDPLRRLVAWVDLDEIAGNFEAESIEALSLTFTFGGQDTDPDYRLWFDRSDGSRFELRKGNEVQFAAFASIFTQAVLRTEKGVWVGHIPLSGLPDIFSHFDRIQERSGTVTALVTPGLEPWFTVPKTPAKPWVYAVPQASELMTTPSQAPGYNRRAANWCRQVTGDNGFMVEAYRLADGTRLWSIRCAQSKRLNPATMWLAQTVNGPIAQQSFAVPSSKGDTTVDVLPHSVFLDDIGGIQSSFVMREDGDCGWQRIWAWTGEKFDLLESYEMPSCRGIKHKYWFNTYETALGSIFEKPDQP